MAYSEQQGPFQANVSPSLERPASFHTGASQGWEFIEETGHPVDAGVYKAISPSDFEQVNTLWRRVYGEEFGWLSPSDGVLLKDRYDSHSTYLLAKIDGQVVGTMRLVTDSDEGLPVEQFVSIEDLRGSRRLMECQRLMILPDYRNKRWPALPHGVLGGLVKGCLHWCLANGVSHILADLFMGTKTTPLKPLMALGFQETGKEFIDSELAESDKSIALILEVGELFSRSFRTTAPFYQYLMEPDDFVRVYK